MTFLEFLGPEKALAYGLAVGFVAGIIYAVWASFIIRSGVRE